MSDYPGVDPLDASSRKQYEKLKAKGGYWCWADLGPTYEEMQTNPNENCFTLVWVPDEEDDEQ